MEQISKLKKYEDELLDYLRTDKDKTTKIKLYKSIKYPDDIIRIKTEKDISPGYNRFSIELIRKSKSPEIISNIYEYKGKESKAFKNMTLEKLIKSSKLTYLSNYLGSIKYNNISPKTSPTLEERINNLPEDMKDEIKKQLMQLKLSPGSKNTRSEINKEFRNGFSYIKRLKQLRESHGREVDSLDTMREINKRVVDILGDITIKKLDTLDNLYVNPKDYIISMRILDSIRKIPDISDRLYDEFIREEKSLGLTKFDSYDKAKKNYLSKHPGKNDFDKKVKSWEDRWNVYHNLYWHFDDIQEAMKRFKDKMINYDPKTEEETKQKIDSFLKLDENITYKEYIDKMQKLPLSVKAVMRAKF